MGDKSERGVSKGELTPAHNLDKQTKTPLSTNQPTKIKMLLINILIFIYFSVFIKMSDRSRSRSRGGGSESEPEEEDLEPDKSSEDVICGEK